MCAATLLGVAACGGSTSKSSGLTDNQAEAEYVDVQATMTLPAGDAWPQLKTRDGQFRIEYDSLGVRTQAQNYWLCSWERSLTQGESTRTQKDRGLKTLSVFPDMDLYQRSYSPDARKLFDTIMASAQLGDFSPMAQDVRTNC